MSKGQKHQNTEAWVPNRADKHNSLQQLVNKLPSGAEAGLCQKCDEVVAWKKQFGKYKPLKQPAKCVACRAPAVMLAYHQLCRACADDRATCAKCMEATPLPPPPSTEEAEAAAKALRGERRRERMAAAAAKAAEAAAGGGGEAAEGAAAEGAAPMEMAPG